MLVSDGVPWQYRFIKMRSIMKLAYVLIFLILSSFAHAGEGGTTNFSTITVEGTEQTVTTPDVVRLG